VPAKLDHDLLMPQAKPPTPPKTPAPLTSGEERYIMDTVRRYYGADAVVRNWGPDPQRLNRHVEADQDIGLQRHECLGVLMCEIVREQISLESTKRGERIRGNAKLAYRQGVVLGGG
jgi:hypothetical protein